MQKRQPGNSALEVSAMGRNQESKPGIPGTTKLHRLEENPGVAEVKLTVRDLKEINNAVSKVEVEGARYPEHPQKRIAVNKKIKNIK
jgi:hypothetical protein